MGLPACQERILSGIENALRQGEPHLVSRFAIFTRLASGEELPRTEQLMPTALAAALAEKRQGCGPLLTVPAALIALAAACFSPASAGARTCPARGPRRPAVADPVGHLHRPAGRAAQGSARARERDPGTRAIHRPNVMIAQ